MEQIRKAIRHMIEASDKELGRFLEECYTRSFRKNEIVSSPGKISSEIFFINNGIIRLTVSDSKGKENTTHFALENQFIADYASFIQQSKSIYTLQCLENTEMVVMPRASVEWGYKHLKQGDKLGRIIAEFYFIYLDNRLKSVYGNNVKERYDSITKIFPNIHNRVPQHMIASYLGITSVHLSRLKKQGRSKT